MVISSQKKFSPLSLVFFHNAVCSSNSTLIIHILATSHPLINPTYSYIFNYDVSTFTLTFTAIDHIPDTVFIHAAILVSASSYVVVGWDMVISSNEKSFLDSTLQSTPSCLGGWGSYPLTGPISTTDDPFVTEDPIVTDFTSNFDYEFKEANIEAVDLITTSLP